MQVPIPDPISQIPSLSEMPLEQIRFSREIPLADKLAEELFSQTQNLPELAEADRVRRSLLTSHVRLTENMAPEVFAYAKRAATALRLQSPIEIYQGAGDENAANWTCAGVAFISLQGKMISLLDEDSFVALFGHEFGHHLAHTDSFSGTTRQHAFHVATRAAYDNGLPMRIRIMASRLAMAKEFTADRFSALAAGSLDATLRLLMTIVTGLPSERLKADGQSYLEQARALFGTSSEIETPKVGTHPEHLLRAYAIFLFSESDVFKQLTGNGPGTRSLDTIDAELENILTGSDEHIFEVEQDHVLPLEVQEFALCAAVLLAHADDEVNESELTVLEETFSTILPDWKELLDHEKALIRYGELLPLMVTGGEAVASSVFSVLIHVMLADKEVHIQELEAISAVGRSLLQEDFFQYLLSALARQLHIEQPIQPNRRPLPALPPGEHETFAALNALFSGMSRRGGGSVALARLLRILGQHTWDHTVLETIENVAKSHHLNLASKPVADEAGTIQLNQILLFRLSDAELAHRESIASMAEKDSLATAQTRDALLVALRLLRERLVSGDGRSPSIRLYQTRSGRHFDLAHLNKVITGRADRIVEQLYDANTISLLSGSEAGSGKTAADLARSIRILDREFKARVEETGATDLYVGYPFLTGIVNGFFVRAPLILHPFSLSGDTRGGSTYVLKRRDDDPSVVNQALIRLLFAKKGYPFTETLANDLDNKAAEGGSAVPDSLREIGLVTHPLTGSIRSFEEISSATALLLPEGLSISENAVIGFFPQSNSDLLHDYDELLARLNHTDPAILQETLNAACDILPPAYRPTFSFPELSKTQDQPIIYADPSQRNAVVQARSNRLLVMDGPPGTGKSQTIVNLVADTLARGGKVAVVCEKRVALDVVKQRLDSAGIGHLAALVHDTQEDRKSLYKQIADRLEHPERRTYDLSNLETRQNEITQLECQLKERSQWLALATPAGLSVGQLHTMAAGLTIPPVIVSGLENLDTRALKSLKNLVKEVHPFIHLLTKDSPFRSSEEIAPRASLAHFNTEKLHQLSQQLQSVCDALEQYAQLYAETPADPSDLEAVSSILKTIETQSEIFTNALSSELPEKMLMALEEHPSLSEEMESWWDQMESNRSFAETEKERPQTEVSPELTAAISAARAQVFSFLRFLKPSWYKASAIIRHYLLKECPDQAGMKINPELLSKIDNRAKAAVAWNAAATLYRTFHMSSSLPRQATELYTQIPAIFTLWRACRSLIQEKNVLQSLALWPLEASSSPHNWKNWIQHCQKFLHLLKAQQIYYEATQQVSPLFPQIPYLQQDALVLLCEAFSRDSKKLVTLDSILEKAKDILPDFQSLAEYLSDTQPTATASQWIDSVMHGWAKSHLAAIEQSAPGIQSLTQPPPLGSAENASAKLLELHKAIANEEALRLAALNDNKGLMAVRPAAPRVRRSEEQSIRENLIRECRKQRNVMPMRTLVRKHATSGLLDVIPIWLMSPETTAILFPREPVFDLLIIDEASQCTVENGLPVLTRAHRAVIAGDDKQMPPSSFFKSATSLDSIGTEEENEETPSDSFEAESLLVLARQGSRTTSLRWHYRSLFEELISFSNHSMYGGSLLTIPAVSSRSSRPALQWVRLQNGTWENGANLPEARRVVDLITELLATPESPSIGVVTFNLTQRRAIMDEIDARYEKDALFAQLYDTAANAESLDKRPFVKNLESVQGDERDVIIFSLGYAAISRTRRDGSEETYVPARFGPLGQKGGERRLNVAVSRAKKKIIVVSSFDPSMLRVARAKNDGPRLFKAFVEFACHLGEGRRNQADNILSLVNDTQQNFKNLSRYSHETDALYFPLAHQITLELEAAGMKVETLIGSSEFRLPVAVVHPQNPHQYAIAILCDEGSAPSNIYEDYVHIPNILHFRQWKHLRVNAHDWHRNKQEIISKIKMMSQE